MPKSKATMPPTTEILLAKIIGLYLEYKGWNAYPEVVLSWFSGRPDYVAFKDSLVMAVECKKTLSLQVLDQLYRWQETAASAEKHGDAKRKELIGVPNLLIAAVFESGSGLPSALKEKLLKDLRIGCWTVSYQGLAWESSEGFDNLGYLNLNGHRWRLDEHVKAKLQPGSRQTSAKLIAQLDPDMKRAISGASGKLGGNYSTPFRRTLMKAVAVLEEHGELHMSKIIEYINKDHGGHHYTKDSAAFQGLSKFLREFGIAEPINGLPNYKLTKDYKDHIYASETATQRVQKEARENETRRKKAKENSSTHNLKLFWEEKEFG